MEFNDLQVIWNSQHDQPMYGVNEEGLHNTLRSKSKRFRRLIFWQYFQTFCSCTFMMMAIAGLLLLNASGVLGRIGSSRALLGWEITALAFALVCWLAIWAKPFGRASASEKARETLYNVAA